MRALCRYWETGALPVGWVPAAAPGGRVMRPDLGRITPSTEPFALCPNLGRIFLPFFHSNLIKIMEVILI